MIIDIDKINEQLTKESKCEHIHTTYNSNGVWCCDCGKTWDMKELTNILQSNSKIKNLTQQNEQLKRLLKNE